MQRLQGWARFAVQQLPVRQEKALQQHPAEEEDAFIYGRVAVHSDDEDEGHPSRALHLRNASRQDESVAAHPEQQSLQQLPGLRPLQLQHSYSESDLKDLKRQADCLQEAPELIRLDSDDGEQPGWASDWGKRDDPAGKHATAPPVQAGVSPAAADERNAQMQAAPHTATASSSLPPSAPTEAAKDAAEAPSAAAVVFEAPTTSSCFETGEDVPDYDHTLEKRELYIYALPLTRGKIIFLPVCPWRSDPESGPEWKKAVAGHVTKVQGEATDMWQKMANAEQGSAVHRLYKFGKRLLDGVPAEERLMRGVPKNVSKVIIHHPTQVSPEAIMEQMQTMTKNYGIKAVGRAAAATVMLPLAIGVDLIILPGPQVLTYYTMWNLYRNTNGALGTSRMTKFITQGGSSSNIRVNYAAEPRLDKYYDASLDNPEGVLSEDDVEALVADIREPDLLEPLLSLRSKALRELGARVSKEGDEYTALPPADPAASPTGFGAGSSLRHGSAAL